MSRPISILIVEDEALIAMILRMSLLEAGYTVCDILSTGESAVEYVQTNRPDLILFDNRLSGKMTGIEAAVIIRRQYDIPVIFVTGYQFEEFTEEAKGVNPIACLSKPLQFSILKNIIDEYFDGY
ncbi:MAG TPA: response regulator [Spirochaetota bacterium]